MIPKKHNWIKIEGILRAWTRKVHQKNNDEGQNIRWEWKWDQGVMVRSGTHRGLSWQEDVEKTACVWDVLSPYLKADEVAIRAIEEGLCAAESKNSHESVILKWDPNVNLLEVWRGEQQLWKSVAGLKSWVQEIQESVRIQMLWRDRGWKKWSIKEDHVKMEEKDWAQECKWVLERITINDWVSIVDWMNQRQKILSLADWGRVPKAQNQDPGELGCEAWSGLMWLEWILVKKAEQTHTTAVWEKIVQGLAKGVLSEWIKNSEFQGFSGEITFNTLNTLEEVRLRRGVPFFLIQRISSPYSIEEVRVDPLNGADGGDWRRIWKEKLGWEKEAEKELGEVQRLRAQSALSGFKEKEIVWELNRWMMDFSDKKIFETKKFNWNEWSQMIRINGFRTLLGEEESKKFWIQAIEESENEKGILELVGRGLMEVKRNLEWKKRNGIGEIGAKIGRVVTESEIKEILKYIKIKQEQQELMKVLSCNIKREDKYVELGTRSKDTRRL